MSRRDRGLDARALEETATEGVAGSGQGTDEVARKQSEGKNSLGQVGPGRRGPQAMESRERLGD